MLASVAYLMLRNPRLSLHRNNRLQRLVACRCSAMGSPVRLLLYPALHHHVGDKDLARGNSFSKGRPRVRLNFCNTPRSLACGMWGGGGGTVGPALISSERPRLYCQDFAWRLLLREYQRHYRV